MEGLTIKSFKEQYGVVGLGIVAAMNESDDKFGRGGGPVLSVSPRSNPIPIFGPNFVNPVANSESEEYTCVISRLGNNMIEKREYFGSEKTIFMEKEFEFEPAEFLSSCYLCEKDLHGLDIYMYRGDKAFCSAECRYKQIMSDERREKRNSRINKKQTNYSTSPCSSQLQFFAGLAAA